MTRHRLTDDQWQSIADIFPPRARTGRRPRDRRTIVDAILWLNNTSAPWRDIPEEFGPWSTVWDLFDKWNADGTLDEIMRRLQTVQVEAGEVDDELWCIDGTTTRAARCSAGGGKKGIPRSPKTTR